MYKHSRLLAGMSLALALAVDAAGGRALAQGAAGPAPGAAAPAQGAAAPAEGVAAPAQGAGTPAHGATVPEQGAAAPAQGAAAAQQGATATEPSAAAPEQPQQTLQVLDGKLRVAIPAGFTETEFPPDPAVPDVTGKIYLNRAAMQAIIVINVPIDIAVGDDDAFTLGSMASGFQSQQQEAVPTFKRTGQSAFKVGGIGVFQVDATSKLSGQPAVVTAMFAGSGKQVVTLTAYTLNQEKARHPELIKQLTEGMSAATP